MLSRIPKNGRFFRPVQDIVRDAQRAAPRIDLTALISLLDRLERVEGSRASLRSSHPASRRVYLENLESVLSYIGRIFSRKSEPEWTAYMRAASFLFKQYTMLSLAEPTERNSARSESHYVHKLLACMKPLDRMADLLLNDDEENSPPTEHTDFVNFITIQLVLTKHHQMLSGESANTFFEQIQRREAAPWLSLLYPIIDAPSTSPTLTAPITLLSIAERSVTAAAGAHEQATFAMFLRVYGTVSSTSARALCAEQIYAMRPATDIWPSLEGKCVCCWEKVGETRRSCSGCERAQYCSDECSEVDWNKGHDKICDVWRLVDARSQDTDMKRLLKSLVLDLPELPNIP